MIRDDGEDLAPGVDEAAEYVMPHAMTVAGLQHVIFNLCEDTHLALQHWAEFFKQLKTLESFLRVEERRQRFCWTCLRNTPLASRDSMFQRFSKSLYEERWREVLSFLSAAVPLLPTLAVAWNEDRFTSGVDVDGISRPVQARRQAATEAGQGMHQFRAEELTALLRSGLFIAYADMALELESTAVRLAQEC